jgi:hypothetical protein
VIGIETSKSSLIPSPRREGSMFPKAERNIVLLKDPNPELGPGSYFKDGKFVKALSKTSKNSNALTADGSTIGRTSAFRNNTENAKKRTYTNTFMNNLKKGKKKVNSISGNFADSDSEEDSTYAPGPGSYYNQSNVSDFKPKSETSPFQYFGSTSLRFSKSDTNKVPGPGSYKEKVQIPKQGPTETSVFRKERRIETIFDKYISSGPGPGKYNDNRTEFTSKKQMKNRKGVRKFISEERRFLYEPECIKNPGPGKYFEKKDPLAIQGPRPKFDANFGAKSHREIDDFLVTHENSPMYNLQDFDAIAQKKVRIIQI